MLLLPNFLIRTEQLTDLEVGKGTEMFRCCRVLRKFRGNGSKWGGRLTEPVHWNAEKVTGQRRMPSIKTSIQRELQRRGKRLGIKERRDWGIIKEDGEMRMRRDDRS